jgi:hypothetical protein
MHKSRYLLAFSTFLLCCGCLSAKESPTLNPLSGETYDKGQSYISGVQQSSESGTSTEFFSPSVGQAFYTIAYELAKKQEVSRAEAEQAIVLLNATKDVDASAKNVLADILDLASKYPDRDYSELVRKLLEEYIADESAELGVAKRAIQYLLDRLNSREDRETFLATLVTNYGEKNTVLGSELATLVGLLEAEKPDPETATRYFLVAYQHNKYNKTAFAEMEAFMPTGISTGSYVEHLRLMLRENPLNLESALAFAQYTEQLELYDVASGAYEYCANLFNYLYPSENIPAKIYLPWAMSNYNTKRGHQKCLQIASDVRDKGQFDLALEAVAGKAAAKMGNEEQSTQILTDAAERAHSYADKEQSSQQQKGSQTNAAQLAWFYCFGLTDANMAINWANKAYAADPNSTTAAEILAYSLVLAGRNEWAKSLIDPCSQTQIAKLAQATIQLSEQQKDKAIETLKAAVAIKPDTLEAERAKEMLVQCGSQYTAPVDADTLMMALKGVFEEKLIPTFLSPEKILSVHLNLHGSKFSYDSDFGAVVAITDNSGEPLIVSDDGLFTGNIRIDAEVSGDLSRKIPKLVNIKHQTSLPIEPGDSMLVPVRLASGELKQILDTHPQASVDITFTVYIDPVTNKDGSVTNRLSCIKPLKLAVERMGIQVSSKFLQTRLNSLARGRQGQKISTVELFAGLLAEQQEKARGELTYKLVYADWMQPMLKSALLQGLADDNWAVRTHSVATMLLLPMDYELISAVSENLNDSCWPVRLITMYVLAKNQGSNFYKVLDHIAKYDSNGLVREMAVALGGTAPEVNEPTNPPQQPAEPNKPATQPKQKDLQQVRRNLGEEKQLAEPNKPASPPKQFILQQPAEPNK